MRYRGRYEHTIDAKGRLAIPARWRTEMETTGAIVAVNAVGAIYDPWSGQAVALPRPVENREWPMVGANTTMSRAAVAGPPSAREGESFPPPTTVLMVPSGLTFRMRALRESEM